MTIREAREINRRKKKRQRREKAERRKQLEKSREGAAKDNRTVMVRVTCERPGDEHFAGPNE